MTEKARYHHGDLRTALIERAIAVIAKGGVEAVSLRGLARDIGVSHAAPMRHFPTRAELLTAIARDGVIALIKAAKAPVQDRDLDALHKLRALAAGYVAWATANPVHHLILRNPDVMRHADAALKSDLLAYAALQRETIAAAQETGWRSDQDPRVLFLQIVAFTAGLAVVATDPLYETPLEQSPSPQIIDAAISAFFAQT